MKEKVLWLLKIVQWLLQPWRGKTAARVKELIMEAQTIIADNQLPEPEETDCYIQIYFDWYRNFKERSKGSVN